MKRLFLLLLLALLAVDLAWRPESPAATWYVQFVRGTDTGAPPTTSARPVGPMLASELHGVFKWVNYWEIQRDTIALTTGATARRKLGPRRDIEVTRSASDSVTISLYLDGKLIRRRTQPMATRFYIAGGDAEQGQCWFVVVRRDKPSNAPTLPKPVMLEHQPGMITNHEATKTL